MKSGESKRENWWVLMIIVVVLHCKASKTMPFLMAFPVDNKLWKVE